MTTIPLPLRRISSVRFVHQWMADVPCAVDTVGLTAYYNCRSLRRHSGFLRYPKKVLELDLAPGADSILAACEESVRYKIRRAPREGVTSELENGRDDFRSFYNVFAESKAISPLDAHHLAAYWPSMTTTKAIHEGENLAMHAYLVDHEASRATLLFSCSHFRNVDDSKHRNFLARASRFLYWDDMRRFASEGIRWYDFGYYGNTYHISQVNEFKKGYPCVEKSVSTFISLPLFLLRNITQPGRSF